MANVMFKRGTQAKFDALTSYTDGVFYLTEDTRRLFVGTEDGKAIPLCETIQFVASLPSTTDAIKGQVYYITTENILCIYDGSSWTQINPDTRIEKIADTVEVADNVATVLTTLTDNWGSTKAGLKTSFGIKGGSGIKVTEETDNIITIAGTTYSLSADVANGTATISLAGEGVDEGSDPVKITQGTGVLITKDASGNIVVGADVSAINTTYTLSKQEHDGKADTGIDVLLKDNEGSTVSRVEIDPGVKVKNVKGEFEDTVAKLESGIFNLDVYSSEAIDQLMMGLNAMTYKGTIGSKSANTKTLPSTASAGDTYLVNNDGSVFKVGTVDAHDGDLIIAMGEETNGVIPQGSLTWEVVPAGNDIDSQYTFKNIGNGVQLSETQGTDTNARGNLTFEAGNAGVSVDVTGTGANTNVAVSHKTVTTTETKSADVVQNPGDVIIVPIVTDVNYDDFGHVTEVVTQNTTFKDTDTVVTESTYAASAASNKATVTNTLLLKDEENGTAGQVAGSFSVESKNSQLTVAATGSNIEIDFIWGSF